MSCDHELANEWAHCGGKNASYITIYRVRTLFQKQISSSNWFFQDSKIHINPFTPKITMFILLTVCHALHMFYLNLTDLQNFPRPLAFFQDFPVLKNATIKFQDFPGFPGPIRTLNNYNKHKRLRTTTSLPNMERVENMTYTCSGVGLLYKLSVLDISSRSKLILVRRKQRNHRKSLLIKIRYPNIVTVMISFVETWWVILRKSVLK